MGVEHDLPPVTSDSYADATYIRNALLGIEFDGTDVETEQLNELCDVASRIIDNYTQNTFYKQTHVEEKKVMTVDFHGNLIVRTQHKPIRSVSEIKIQGYPVNMDMLQISPLPSFAWDVNHKQGYVVVFGPYIPCASRSGYKTLITYESGPDTVPSPIRRACALLVRNMILPGELSAGKKKDQSVNLGDLKRVKSKSYEEEYDTTAGSSGGFTMKVKDEQDFLLTSDIRAILSPYAKIGVL